MALSKKIQNLIISLDVNSFTVSIMQNYGNEFRKATIEQFDCDKELFENKKVFDILDSVLAVYFMDKAFNQPDVYIVLPDYFIAIDHITIPTMQKTKLKDALRTELKKYYYNYRELEINSNVMQKNKKNVNYCNVMVQKDIITDCILAVKKHNLNLKNISYASNSIINSFLALGNKIKHSNYLFVDIGELRTKIIYCSKDKTLCFEELPYGYNFLSKEKLNFEVDFYDNEKVNEVVYNAKEIARAKRKNKDEKSEKYEVDTIFSFDDYIKAQNFDIKKTIIHQRKPEFENQSIIYANFQAFIKHILLIQKAVKINYDFPEPEYAVVNLPEAYRERLGKIENPSIKFRWLNEELLESCPLSEFLELYGMIYAVIYNKWQNFNDKEKQTIFATIKMNFAIIFEKIKSFFRKLFRKKFKDDNQMEKPKKKEVKSKN